jgi:hypothetical protein
MSTEPISQNPGMDPTPPYDNPNDLPSLNLEEGEGDSQQGSGDSFQHEPLTANQIRQLYQKVEKSGSPDTKHLLSILDEAAKDLKVGDSEHAFEDYNQVAPLFPDKSKGKKDSDPFANYGSPQTEGNDQGGNPNPAPSRVQEGTNYFEATSPKQDFQLTDTGDGSKNVITTDGNVTLAPMDPLHDTVKISSDATSYIFSFTHKDTATGKTSTTTWKVDRMKAKSIHLAMDPSQVSGGIDNSKGQISVGTDHQEAFISSSSRQSLGSQISGSVGKVGYQTRIWMGLGFTTDIHYHPDPFGVGSNPLQAPGTPDTDPPGATYTVGWQGTMAIHSNPDSVQESKAESDDVKSMLTQIGQAVSEKDAAKRADLWSSISENLSRWKSQDDQGGGYCNNRAQLLFNVLHGELGEEGFKKALQSGLLDPGFAKSLASDLTARPDENNNLDSEITNYQSGGPSWTHQTSADFLNTHVASGDNGDTV